VTVLIETVRVLIEDVRVQKRVLMRALLNLVSAF
jgi:hypothetical protein